MKTNDIEKNMIELETLRKEVLIEMLSEELLSICSQKEELIEKFIDLLLSEYQKINETITRDELLNLFKTCTNKKISGVINIKAFKEAQRASKILGH